MQAGFALSKQQIPGIVVTALFALFVVMLPRYTDTAKTWFALLILGAAIYLVCNWRQLRQTSQLERVFFAVLFINFTWIAFCYYANGEPGRGSSFLWGRHFYMLFLMPLFFMFRSISISDRTIVLVIFCSVLVSFADIGLDLWQGVDHREQGMNPNKFGPVQLCLSGMLFFYFLKMRSGPLRLLAFAGFLLGLSTVILSLSKLTLLTLALLTVFFVFYLAGKVPTWKKLAVASIILAMISASYAVPKIQKRIDRTANNISEYFASEDYRDEVRIGSFGTRMELWITGWKIFLENPVTGVGVGGFKVMAKANSERYQVNDIVNKHSYAHNQYIAALATRGMPGLILFLLLMALPLYIAMTQRAFDRESEIARLSLILISLTFLIGCLGEDHFEGKSATMMVAVFVALWLARLSSGKSGQSQASPA